MFRRVGKRASLNSILTYEPERLAAHHPLSDNIFRLEQKQTINFLLQEALYQQPSFSLVQESGSFHTIGKAPF